MNKQQLLSFLSQIGARAQKALSQNFLINPEIVDKIVHVAGVEPGDHVLEIGPGPGALTEKLLEAGAHVFAIEMDSLFAEHLHRFQTPDHRLTVRATDFLKFPLDTLTGEKWKVVANLPYQITSPILEKLCLDKSAIASMTIMVQKEVADRIKAKPKTKAFGSLTLFLQYYTQYRDSFHVGPENFYPAPSVDSTVIRLDKRPPPAIEPEKLFPLIRKAFQQRRKMISSSLKSDSPNIAALLESIGASPKARPEELSLDEWIAFVRKIND